MKALQAFVLYFIPAISILIFAYYTLSAGSGNPAGWGAAHGVHAWAGDRDQRFSAGLETLLRGIEAYRHPLGA